MSDHPMAGGHRDGALPDPARPGQSGPSLRPVPGQSPAGPAEAPRAAPGRLRPGLRAYAIGDVHGCDDRLAFLHGLVAADLERHPVPDSLLVHLGDYVDRGPDSAGVVRRLARPLPTRWAVHLAGNHEAMMLDALGGQPGAVRHWLDNSGASTLRSWGIDPDSAVRGWAQALPAADLATLRSLSLWHRLDGYLFVHAGLRPGAPLEHQSRHDLLWIREGFLDSMADLGAMVVHGHTPSPGVQRRPNRLGIDTGAVAGGALTCAVLEGDSVRFLQA